MHACIRRVLSAHIATTRCVYTHTHTHTLPQDGAAAEHLFNLGVLPTHEWQGIVNFNAGHASLFMVGIVMCVKVSLLCLSRKCIYTPEIE